MKTVIFLMLPYSSHLMPCFGLAREWQDKGYKVIFTGNENLQELIESEGFYFYNFQYGVEYNIENYKAFFGIFLKSIVDKNFIKQRYKEFLNSIRAVENLIKSINPNMVFVDEGHENYYLILKKYGIETKFLNTKFIMYPKFRTMFQ